MLQAFATTKMLEKRGICYELIRYEKKYSLVQKIKFIPRLFNSVLLKDKTEAIKKKMGMKKHPEFAKNDAIRMEAFHKFQNEKFKGNLYNQPEPVSLEKLEDTIENFITIFAY